MTRTMVRTHNGRKYWVEISDSGHPLFSQCVKLYYNKDDVEPFKVSEFDPR